MHEQKDLLRRRNIGVFIILGAVGFGIGGAVGGAITAYSHTGYGFLGFPILGAIGGATLGLALRDGNKTKRLAVAGVIGFLIGHILSFGFGMGLGETLVQFQQSVSGKLEIAIFILMGIILGAVGGASLGIVLKTRKGVGFLALAGAIGFGVSEPFALGVIPKLFTEMPLLQIVPLCVSGISGGAMLGVALGYLEKQKAAQST